MTPPDRLQHLLGAPELAWLVERLRQRIERGRGVDGTITLRAPSESQREAIARLFGRPISSAVISVRLRELDTLLRQAELCDGLIEAIARLSGPLADRRGEQAASEAKWRAVFENAEQQIDGRLAIRRWLDELRVTGLLQRLAQGDVGIAGRLVGSALGVADRLPAVGVPLAELAATVTGDSHALDRGEPLGTLVVRLAAALAGAPAWRNAGDRRDVWASVGVLCDELSAPVLTINLRGGGATLTDRALTMHAEAGEPYRLSVRQLLRTPPTLASFSSAQAVYICENPTVVGAVASRLGPRSAPLICIEGQAKTAARLLIAQLVTAGARLLYHGDFDWGGIRIANVVIARYGATPWRFSAADYRPAAAAAALYGPPVVARWDAELTTAMAASGRAVYEEQELTTLLSDLATHAPDTG